MEGEFGVEFCVEFCVENCVDKLEFDVKDEFLKMLVFWGFEDFLGVFRFTFGGFRSLLSAILRVLCF